MTKCCSLDLKKFSNLLKSISEITRLQILCLLKNKEQCVCDLQKYCNIPHNLALHHLNTLKKMKLITSRQKGKYTFYRLSKKEFSVFLKNFKNILGG